MNKREIKFRVWTGSVMEYKIMVGFLGTFYVQGIDEKDAACMSPYNTKYFPETPVMQYTGLKDKNGKEIYEGDILTNKLNAIGEVCFKNGKFICKMFYKDNSQKVDFELMNVNDVTEVIGNIYENPELLNK